MIIKPESSPHLKLLEEILSQNNFPIKKMYTLQDWGSTSREIYAPQLASLGTDFKVGYEGHVWLINHLFGNRGTILLFDENLSTEDPYTQERLTRLYEVKQQFRNKVSHSLNGTLVFNIDLNKLEGEAFKEGGETGYLGTFKDEKFTSFSEGNIGRWEDFFLKYVHSPDPNIESLAYEWSVLIRRGVLKKENLIKEEDWKLMKFLKTQIPLTEHV